MISIPEKRLLRLGTKGNIVETAAGENFSFQFGQQKVRCVTKR